MYFLYFLNTTFYNNSYFWLFTLKYLSIFCYSLPFQRSIASNLKITKVPHKAKQSFFYLFGDKYLPEFSTHLADKFLSFGYLCNVTPPLLSLEPQFLKVHVGIVKKSNLKFELIQIKATMNLIWRLEHSTLNFENTGCKGYRYSWMPSMI